MFRPLFPQGRNIKKEKLNVTIIVSDRTSTRFKMTMTKINDSLKYIRNDVSACEPLLNGQYTQTFHVVMHHPREVTGM